MSQGITFSGLSSGIDVNSIVTQLMNLEKVSVNRIKTQQAKLSQQQGVYGAFKSRITAFTTALSSLNQVSAFNPLKAASTNSDAATLTTSSGAVQGSYSLKVFKLAQAHKISSTAQASTTEALNQTGVFKVNGKEITVEASDNLGSIASKINTADAGVTASLINGGAGKAYLTLTAKESGAGSTISLEDVSGGALASLGSFGTQILGAQDAEFELDGLTLNSNKNEIADVIPGSTLTLKKAALDGSVGSTLTITRDADGLKSKMKEFRDSYNAVIDFIAQNSQFDSETYSSGPLFGDSSASQVTSTMGDVLLRSVGSGSVNNLIRLGFGLDEAGRVTFDEAAFDKVAAEDPNAPSRLFAASGSSTTSALRYVSSSAKTKAGNYEVIVTQAATRSSGTAGMAQANPSGGGETLTFGGSVLGGRSVVLTTAGGSAADLVNQINNDSRLRDYFNASLDNDGKLKIESRGYGSGSSFTLASDQAASDSNSGIGTSGLTVTAGLDAAGTINGQTATGTGQFLMGPTGSTVEGLQVMYTGSTTGTVGSLSFSQGIANQMTDSMFSFTDSVNGLLTALDKSIQEQIDDMSDKITRLNDSFVLKEQTMRKKFAVMEEMISKFQSQGTQIASFASSLRANSS